MVEQPKTIIKQAGQAVKAASAPGTVLGSPSARAGIKTANSMSRMAGPKPFDFGLYMEAAKTAFKKFFKEQVPYFFKNSDAVMKNVLVWWKKQKQDEQIAYGVWVGGHVIMLVGIILLIVL